MDDCTRMTLTLARRTNVLLSTAAKTFTLSDSRGGSKTPTPKSPPGRPDPNLALLEQLHQQAISIGDVSGQIKANFPNEKGADSLLSTLDKMLTTVKKRIDDTRADVSKKALTKVDAALLPLLNKVEDHLETQFKNRVGNVGSSVLLGPTTIFKGTDLVNTSVGYIKLVDLHGTDGFIHPLTYVFIGIPDLEGNKETYYAATSTEFKTPKQIRWEAAVSNKNDLLTVVNDLLIQDGLISKAFARNLPIPKDAVKLAHDAIAKTRVDESSITVWIKPKYDIDVVRNELFKQLLILVRQIDPKNKDVLRYVSNPNTRSIKFVFTLPKRLTGRIVPDTLLIRIARLIGESDPAVMQRIRTALEDPK